MANLSPLRELDTFLFAPVVRAKLSAAGFCLINDLQNLQPSKLSQGTIINICLSLFSLQNTLGSKYEMEFQDVEFLPSDVFASHLIKNVVEGNVSGLPYVLIFCSG